MTTTRESKESLTSFSIGVVEVAGSSSYKEKHLVLTLWQDDGQKLTALKQLDFGPIGSVTERELGLYGTLKCSMKDGLISSLLFPGVRELV
jgi:hypothetical protein